MIAAKPIVLYFWYDTGAVQRKQNSDGGSTYTASSASSFPQMDVIGSDLEG